MMMMMLPETMKQFGSGLATLMFIWAMYHQYLPRQIRDFLEQNTFQFSQKLVNYFSPYLDITFDEYTGEYFDRSEIYTTIQTYISDSSSMKARKMKANSRQGKSLVLSLGEQEEVTELYQGITVWWSSKHKYTKGSTITFYPGSEEKRFYKLTFHRRHRKIITGAYLNYVLEEGKAIEVRRRQRKLFTNTGDSSWTRRRSSMWSHIDFQHPASFDTLAMDPNQKKKIKDDLLWFSKAKDYYHKVGKPWKRGYLLYGPPGTGKSTMVASIANLLEYDIYDLELTAVKDNTQLRKLLIETKSKAIILIEDIDCSLDLTGQRKKKDEEEDTDEKDPVKKALMEKDKKKGSEVTLSGLLNFIDGIWSACGEERVVIFTTNFIDKLDPALIRRGRMDMHVEMSYCSYEVFKALAKNYLDIDSHYLFGTIEHLLGEIEITPADVAENLMPKSDDVDNDMCLQNVVAAIEKAKVDAAKKLKDEEEERKLKEEKKKQKEEEGDKEKNDAKKKDENEEKKTEKQEKEEKVKAADEEENKEEKG